ncbi:MAG: hypothetical protein H7Y27_14275 [Gemmatimonadaceae bacterium]|nr:hypothetical protein [Chitinophagaceae bacterium]
MKKFLLSLALLPIFTVCFSQTKTETSTKTVVTKPASTTIAKQSLNTTGTNTIKKRLPELRITAAAVTAVSTGQGVYKLTISCTVKNEGNAPMSLADINFSGLHAPERYMDMPLNSTGYSAACGSTGGLAYEFLQPGASLSREYFCFNRALNPGEKPVYVIIINRSDDMRDQTNKNIRQNVYITFN